MTQSQATAEVFYTAFQALTKSEREAFIAKLLQDKKLAEDFRHAVIIEKRPKEPTVSLDDHNKLDVFKSIQSGVKEVTGARKSGRKLQKLSRQNIQETSAKMNLL